MYTAQLPGAGTYVIRYPKGRGVMTDWQRPMEKLNVGTGNKISEGSDIAIVSIGPIGNEVIQATEKLKTKGISAAHYDIRFLKPIDENLLHDIFRKFDKIISVEDGTIIGGLGSAIAEFMADHHYEAQLIRLGIPDRFIEQGSVGELWRECGYDAGGIYDTVLSL